MIEALFEIIFSFTAELVVELVVQALVELGFHGTAEKVSDTAKNRIVLGCAYALFGSILGGLSLLVFPKMVFADPGLPVLYFVFSPIIAGLALSIVSWLINRGIRPVSWFEPDKFVFGVVFALGYSLSRVIFG